MSLWRPTTSHRAITDVTPYYSHAGITIYHGDCRDVLPTLGKFDLLLTDPPYGINGGGKGNYESQLWDDTPEYIERVIVPAFIKSLSQSQRGIVTPGYRHMRLYPPPDDIGCMWTPASVGRGPWGFNTFNPILYYGA